ALPGNENERTIDENNRPGSEVTSETQAGRQAAGAHRENDMPKCRNLTSPARVVSLLLCLFALGCDSGNANRQAEKKTKVDPNRPKADFALDAKQFYAECSNDLQAAGK